VYLPTDEILLSRGFDVPNYNVALWRYMDVGRFLALLHTSSLYFSRLNELEDAWEGAHPRALDERIRSTSSTESDYDSWKMRLTEFGKRALVSCWHAGEHESVAMWNLYTSGAEGVAVRSTVGRLRAALASYPYYVSKVRYIDYAIDDVERGPDFFVFSAVLCKRRSFEHEREVRIVVDGTACPDTPDTRGVAVPIKIRDCVERIVVSPGFPNWAVPALQNFVDQTGLDLRIETSDLLKKPGEQAEKDGT
jgi:hypothetical protein